MVLLLIVLLSSLFFIIMEILLDSFKYGIVPAILILIYLVFTRILDHRQNLKKIEKEKEQEKKTIKVNAEVINSFNEIANYLKSVTKDIVELDSDKAVAAIRSSFRSMNFGLTRFATFTIINNNIKTNRASIIDNINATVEAEYLNVYNELVLYKDKINRVSEYLDPLWKDEMIKVIVDIIFNNKLTKEQKIYNVHNVLGIDIANYSNIVYNKFVNK